jgi:hypothetical protein
MRTILCVLLYLAASVCRSEDRSAELQLLFGQEAGGLSVAEQQAIFETLDLVLAEDGVQFLDRACRQPATATLDHLDLNHDGTPEVLVTYGNSCISGITGSSVLLFVKRDGRYEANLGFPAAEVTPLESSHLGYADLLIGGRGFCFPVWRWNGQRYEHLRNEPQEPGGCDFLER